MEEISVGGLTLYFPAGERAAGELVRGACKTSISLIRASWGLELPADLRVYVLGSSWLRATFHSVPWRWRPAMVLSLPLWYPRGRQLWQVAGGWQQQYGSRRTVCVKAPRLLAQADKTLGERIFVHEPNLDAKVQQITCHELTHAFTADLKLPVWLNEGLAVVTAERFAEKPMVRRESLDLLAQPAEIKGSLSRQAATTGGMEAVVALYARGYWRTRCLEETRPGLLRTLFAQHVRSARWDRLLAAAFDASPDESWPTIDDTVMAFFTHQVSVTTEVLKRA